MNINSFKTMTEKEKNIYKKIYSSLKEGKPLTKKEFKILMKAYEETSKRSRPKNENSV